MTRISRVHRVALSIVAALGILASAIYLSVPLQVKLEMLSLYAFPDAQRAYELGRRHFSSGNARAYDLDAAEHFYWRAYALDSTIPHLYHELARIAFLRGELDTALVFINAQIDMRGDELPNSYYMRGLIQGYRGDYASAASDYEVFLDKHPHNWAGLTDYAWVLVKGERHQEAAVATEKGLAVFPTNPWLLNTNAIALYELGNYTLALERAKRAVEAAAMVTTDEWLTAYPGNDPRVAGEGIGTLQRSASQNMHMIEAAVASSTVQ